jgi:TRAP-type transport system small permease protein
MRERTILEKISYYIDKIIGYICIIMGITMTVTTLLGILFRYIMTNPLPWTEELARYSMIWMGLLAISIGVRRNLHLGVEMFMNKFPMIIRRIITYFSRLLIGFFLYMLSIYGYDMAINGLHQTSPGLQISMFYVLISIPISAILALIQLMFVTVIDIQNNITGLSNTDIPEGRKI